MLLCRTGALPCKTGIITGCICLLHFVRSGPYASATICYALQPQGPCLLFLFSAEAVLLTENKKSFTAEPLITKKVGIGWFGWHRFGLSTAFNRTRRSREFFLWYFLFSGKKESTSTGVRYLLPLLTGSECLALQYF